MCIRDSVYAYTPRGASGTQRRAKRGSTAMSVNVGVCRCKEGTPSPPQPLFDVVARHRVGNARRAVLRLRGVAQLVAGDHAEELALGVDDRAARMARFDLHPDLDRVVEAPIAVVEPLADVGNAHAPDRDHA